jgi:hypothetical protein
VELPPDADQILRQARRRRAHGLITGLVVLLACTFLALHYRLYAGWFGSFLLSPTEFLILVLASRFQKGDRLVLWLRRFHVRRPGGTHFDRLLQGACGGFGFPLTVQDSTFKSSLAMSAVKMQILATPLMLGSLVVVIVTYQSLARAFGLSDPFTAPGLPGFGFWLFMGVWIVACVLLGISAYRRLGYVLLKPSNAREKTLRVIRQITRRKGWRFDIGIFVIHCDDSFWREIVELCLTCASTAVIDVTEPSQNVIWELETAFRLMAPESIVLACAVGEGAPKEVPRPVCELLLAHLPGPAFARAQTFFYPLHQAQLGQHPWGRRKDLQTELETRLASAMATPSPLGTEIST